MNCTEAALREMVKRHGGVVASGRHDDPTGPLCILELGSACLVEDGYLSAITDDPAVLGRPDYRPINDASWSSRAAATEPMLRLHLAYASWGQWSTKRRRHVVEQIVRGTVREIVAELPGLSDTVRDQCREATSSRECAVAARAAASEAWKHAEEALEEGAGAASGAWEVAARVASAAEWAVKDGTTEAARAAASAAEWAVKDGTTEAADAADAVLLRVVDLWCAAAR